MVSKDLLLLGGLGLAGYLILRSIEGAGAAIGLGGPRGPLGDITPGIQAGASALGAGAVNVVGAGVTGVAEGATEAFLEGLEESTKPFEQPLRTIEPVLDARQIPFSEQLFNPVEQRPVFFEQPVITPEELEERKRPQAGPTSPFQPGQRGPVSFLRPEGRANVGLPPTVQSPPRSPINLLFPGLFG